MDAKQKERHVVAEFECGTESIERVKELLLQLIGPARQEDGCLYYDLYQTIETPTRFYILDGWRDQVALDAHGNHPNVGRVVTDLLPLLQRPIVLTNNARISDAPQYEGRRA